LLRDGWSSFLRSPDPYVLLAVGLVQAYFLGSWQHAGRPRPFFGNLIGPALYTLFEGIVEGFSGGMGFFLKPHHEAYWAFSIAIGILQHARLGAIDRWLAVAATLAENIVRVAIVVVMYAIFESITTPKYATFDGFLSDASHVYIGLMVLALGVVIGVARVTSDSYLELLRSTAEKLRRYSELAMGRGVLERAVQNEAILAPTRRSRTVVFLDIRGFTAWSERQTPEEVVRMLNAFYEAAEATVAPFAPIRIKYTADEALLVFDEPATAVAAARALRAALAPQLAPFGLAAGFGISGGPVIEGLLGSESVKAFDVLGDTVNAAKRLCDAAGGGEILVAADLAIEGLADVPLREIQAKGKAQPISVRVLGTS
ncbi:MAG TPA: adenylate/guanylate cyclase domain-containing protein, partial [Usitatibacteraceae bacterium]|nr:adenylate/guanylate cyclase domain-containing protein [Usitatibacteraceae bacterium]